MTKRRHRLKKGEVPEHGTWAMYRKCGPPRCEKCRGLRSRTSRERRAEIRGTTPPVHNRSGYINYGCLCRKCKDDHNKYMRQYMSSHPEQREKAIERERQRRVRNG